jgi:hypothetical protein
MGLGWGSGLGLNFGGEEEGEREGLNFLFATLLSNKILFLRVHLCVVVGLVHTRRYLR